MWDETPTSWQLRMAFPQEAKALEDIMIANRLQSLGLITTKLGSTKASHFRIKLEDQYELLTDAVYKRRGWNNNGVPKIEFLKKIGMDLPEVIDVVKNFQ